MLESDSELKVVGEARNGEEAVALARWLKPDVVTMDIRMPRMDGFEAIRHIMAEKPVPIVVVTSVDLDREMGVSSQATRAGAVSVLRRPARISDPEYKAFTARLVGQVKLMSDVKVVHRPMAGKTAPTPHVPQMDIQMPRMDGNEATRQIMATTPTPIVVVSSVTRQEMVHEGLDVLLVGALEIVQKPSAMTTQGYETISEELLAKVKATSGIAVQKPG